MKVVGIVAGSGRQVSRREMAAFLYDSAVFRARVAWLKMQAVDDWAILSAKHFVLPRQQRIDPYDVKITDLDAVSRRRWANITRRQLQRIYPEARFVVLASPIFRGAFVGLNHDVPFAGYNTTQEKLALEEAIEQRKTQNGKHNP